ncbi:SRPBCC family protein [Cellulomonas sp. NPDC089187]|uniref:SRPBCC family protein n=1 Tax=Cellulomonas sp. NPDC089187 TaxID=3154970 RepID=UPI003420EA44
MATARVLRTLTTGAALTAGYVLARQRALRLGATQVERSITLAGDELLPDADLVATRAITIQAPASAVYPWLLQLGQGRGGFYSYDALENLLGVDIHSAEEIVPALQDLAEGDTVRLAEQVSLTVARLDPDHAVVLHGEGPALPDEDEVPFDFVWSFVLRPGQLPNTTRLIVRERYGYRESWARWMVEALTWASTIMTDRMLRGVRDRAEQRG